MVSYVHTLPANFPPKCHASWYSFALELLDLSLHTYDTYYDNIIPQHRLHNNTVFSPYTSYKHLKDMTIINISLPQTMHCITNHRPLVMDLEYRIYCALFWIWSCWDWTWYSKDWFSCSEDFDYIARFCLMGICTDPKLLYVLRADDSSALETSSILEAASIWTVDILWLCIDIWAMLYCQKKFLMNWHKCNTHKKFLIFFSCLFSANISILFLNCSWVVKIFLNDCRNIIFTLHQCRQTQHNFYIFLNGFLFVPL